MAEVNGLSKVIGELFKQGKKEEADASKEKTALLKEKSKQLSAELDAAEKALVDLLVQIPNLPHSSVPAFSSALISAVSMGIMILPFRAFLSTAKGALSTIEYTSTKKRLSSENQA